MHGAMVTLEIVPSACFENGTKQVRTYHRFKITLFSKIHQMLSPEDEYLSVDEASQKLLERITEYYTLQIDSIGPEEYAFIQKTIKYPESYEEHIDNLKNALRPPEETLSHIQNFLTMYSEFTHPQYCEILDYVIKILLTNPAKARESGINALMSLQKTMEEDNEGKEIPEQSLSNIPDEIPFQIGRETLVLPTHQDPLMVSLYSVCVLAFSMRFQHQ